MTSPRAYTYPKNVHTRRHHPKGYTDYPPFKDWLRDEFEFRCVYCLKRERFTGGHHEFGVDHFIPKSTKDNSGVDYICDYDNLLYSCNRCNTFKGTRCLGLNPCTELLSKHILFKQNGEAEALSDIGYRAILVLQLNDADIVSNRRAQISNVERALSESLLNRTIYVDMMGYPDNLPNLRSKKPPKGNVKPEGVEHCFYERRRRGELANPKDVY